jgi:hypothetical protein
MFLSKEKMMKKLLILMLVLGLTSVANAALVGVELSVNGVTDGPDNTTYITIAPCDTIVIDVFGPADTGWFGVVAIMGSFPNVTGGEWGDELGPPYDPLCSSYYYEAAGYPKVLPGAGDILAMTRRIEYDDWGYGYELSAASATSVPGGKQFEYLYHCCLPDEVVTIQLWDAYDWALADTIVVTQPEPMTIMLLGLGGLLLRRRK